MRAVSPSRAASYTPKSSRSAASCAGATQTARLSTLARKALHARDLPALLGLEGAAGATYFGAWPDLLRHRGQVLSFAGRSRRPPRDPPNALLSYFYAVLAGECLCATAAAGFDPRVGFLHSERDGRFALALDLLELFRAPVADTAALMALNTGEIERAHFADEQETRLTDEGRRAAIAALERRLSAPAIKDGEMRGFSFFGRGVAQGAPISPLLSNLYLHPVDRLLSTAGLTPIRYADDLVIPCATKAQADAALELAVRLLRERGLRANAAKTKIHPPGAPFDYLGAKIAFS